jgi:hypothetical protein
MLVSTSHQFKVRMISIEKLLQPTLSPHHQSLKKRSQTPFLHQSQRQFQPRNLNQNPMNCKTWRSPQTNPQAAPRPWQRKARPPWLPHHTQRIMKRRVSWSNPQKWKRSKNNTRRPSRDRKRKPREKRKKNWSRRLTIVCGDKWIQCIPILRV